MERTNKVRKMVVTAMLAAVVVVLQMLSSAMNIGGFPITLTLVPIVIGAIVYGPLTGAVLGAAFGVVVCVGVINGTDFLGHLMFQNNPFLTLFVCLFKGVAAGFVAGAVYGLFKKQNKKMLGTMVSAILCPIINTSLLLVVMITFFETIVTKFALDNSFSSAKELIVTGIIVANFLPELLVNAIVTPAVAKTLSKIK